MPDFNYFVLGASLLFHLVYGAVFGLLAGRTTGVMLIDTKVDGRRNDRVIGNLLIIPFYLKIKSKMTSMKLLINEMDTNTLDTNSLNIDINNSIDSNKQKKIRILVSGASGFIGRRLVRRLLVSPSTTNWSIRCTTRKPNSFSKYFQNGRDNLELVQA